MCSALIFFNKVQETLIMQTPDVLVVLSGGADSTICLALAKTQYKHVHAITFNYGQRHAIEIESAKAVAKMIGVASHEVVDVGPLLVSSSPLVSSNAVGHYDGIDALPGGVEPTFIPGRNALFLVLAANRAAALDVKDIMIGVCQEDFGGYPDCRQRFIDTMSTALSEGFLGQASGFNIITPLMDLTKKESVILANNTPGAMEAMAYSHTCYDGQYPPNPNNHASLLRARGFAEAGLPDPLILRAKKEGLLPAGYPDSGLVEKPAVALSATPRAATGAKSPFQL